jgi:hypothetical protein
LLSSAAFGGIVSFVPRTPTTVQPGETVAFDIVVSASSLPTFDTVFMLVGSDSQVGFQFSYDRDFFPPLYDWPTKPTSFGVFASDIAFGGNRFADPAFATPLLVGVLRVDTSGTPIGEHELFVSSSREIEIIGLPLLSQLARGPIGESLEGRTSITVVPEPSGLMILIVGAVAARFPIRRPHRRATR